MTDSREGRFGQRGGRRVLPTVDNGVTEIDVAVDLADSKAGDRWAAPTGWPIVDRADMDNAAVDTFYPPWIRGFPKSLSR